MKKALRIVAWAAMLALLATSALLAQGPKASASGSGIFKTTGSDGHPQYRTFTFNAVTHQDNNTTGKVEIQNRELGTTTHIEINCLHVENNGKVARLSGRVERSNNPDWAGKPVWFKVIDNGEGAKAPPDQISLVWFYLNDEGPSCSDLSVDYGTQAIEGGNIQVR